MKLLMVDNYDSFTYNLVQYFGELGADVQVVRNDEIPVEAIDDIAPDKIVLSPALHTDGSGHFHPNVAAFCRQDSHFGRMPWASIHRASLRRQNHPRQRNHARQNFLGTSQRHGRFHWLTQPI